MKLGQAAILAVISIAASAQLKVSGAGTISGSGTISAQSGQPTTVYASPVGSDSNDCSSSNPCLTPQRLTTLLGSAPAGTKTAIFRGGFYPSTVWTLGAGDAGAQGNPVSYQAYPGETPVISGGRQISGTWTKGAITCGGQCQEWDITLDANPADPGYFVKFESLFYNGERRYRPKTGVGSSGWSYQSGMKCVATSSAACPVQGNCATGQFQCHDRYVRDSGDSSLSSFHAVTGSCTTPGNCTGVHEVEILGMENWTGALMRLTPSSNDGTNACTTSSTTYCLTGITGAAPNFGPRTNHHYLRVNALEDLNQPGQFYLDVCPAHTDCSAGVENSFKLMYLARAGENPNTDAVVVPQVGKILSAANLQDVTFSGLTFAHDSFVTPPAGQTGTSFAANVAAGMSFQNSSHVTFDKTTWTHTGNWALEFKGTAAAGSGNTITNFVCTDAGVGCIRIGAMPSGGDTDASVAQYNLISNGVLAGGMRMLPIGPGNALLIGNSHHNTATNLLIDDWYNAPVNVGESQGYDLSSLAHDNVVTRSVISNFGQGVTSDIGAIHFASGAAAGNSFSYNVAHDATEDTDQPGYNGECIYVDNSSSYVSIIGNLAYRCSEANLLLNSNTDNAGRGNVVSGNIFSQGMQGAIKQTTSNSYLDLTATNNIFLVAPGNVHGGPQFAHDVNTPGVQWHCQGTSCPSIFNLDYNTYWNPSMDLGSSSQVPWYTTNASGSATWMNWAAWKALGEDVHSTIADPGFVGPSFALGDDYRFKGNPPAGFTPVDYNSSGPVGLSMPAAVPAGFPLSLWPLVGSASPSSGTNGTIVSITGKNFQNGATVSFEGTGASSVTFVDSTHLTVVVPAGTGAADITVTNPNGMSDTLPGGFSYTSGGGSQIQLPRVAVNNHEFDADLAAPAVTKNIKSNGSGDYPWTCAGIQSAMNAWAAAPDQAWLVKIDPGVIAAGTTGCIDLPTKLNATHFLILQSSNPPTRGQTVCAHGLGTAVSGSARSLGCTTDIARLWQLQISGLGNVIDTNGSVDSAGNGPNHIVLMDFAASPTSSVTTENAPVRIGTGSETTAAALPSHIHLQYFYVHGDAGDTFTPGTPPGNNILANDMLFNCVYCSSMWFYMDKSIRPGAEGHGISIVNTPGPMKITNFWIEGNSSGIFHGGQHPGIPGIVSSSDEEVRVGTLTYPAAWIGANWGSNGPVRKNAMEIKEGARILFDGVVFENVDQTGGQGAPCTDLDVRNTSGGAYGDNYVATIHDVTISNSIFRNCLTLQNDAGSGGSGNGGGAATHGYNVRYANNLLYNMDGDTYCVGGGTCTPYRVPALSVSSANWTGSAARDGSTGNITLTLTDGGTGYHQTNMSPGDPVMVANCADSSFNVSPGVMGPPALAGTSPTGLKVIYNNGSTGAGSTTGCTFYNQEGYWNNFQFVHNTIVADFGSNSSYGLYLSSCPNTNNTVGYPRNLKVQDNLWAVQNWGGMNGNGAAEGSSGPHAAEYCIDTSTFTFDHDVYPQRNGANYTAYPSGLKGNVAGSNLWFPAQVYCTNTNPQASGQSCVGMAGMLSGSFNQNPADYHVFELCGGAGTPLGCAGSSQFAAGQVNDASDGTDVGANIPSIDAAQQLNQYPGFYPSR